MNEFTHHRSDNKFRRLSGSRKTVAETFAPRGFIESDYGRHVEHFTEKGMADFGKPWFVFNTATRLMLTRIKSSESHCLPGIAEAVKVGIESQQDSNGALAQGMLPELLSCSSCQGRH